VTATIARIKSLEVRDQKYSTSKGGPPYDKLAKIGVQTNNATNEGGEALFALQNRTSRRDDPRRSGSPTPTAT
jgi:hypothetical protein